MLRSRVLFFALSTASLLGCTAVLGSFTVDPNADGDGGNGSSSSSGEAGSGSSSGGSSGTASSSGSTSTSSGGSSSGGSSSGGSSGGSSSGGSSSGAPSDAGLDAKDSGSSGGLTYGVNVTKQGTGTGLVQSQPAAINCGSTCTAQFTGGTQVTLTASATPPSVFVNWTGDCTGSSTTCQVTVNKTLSIGASFQGPYTLTLQNAGTGKGTVMSNPSGINCSGQTTCTGQFPPGTSVTLTAQPIAGYVFMGWKGACSGPQPTCTVALNGDKSVEADFGTPATWDPNWSATGIVYSNANLTVAASANTQHVSARTNFGRAAGSGKFYWEIKVVAGNKAADEGGLGIVDTNYTNNAAYIGYAANSFGFGYGTFQQYWNAWANTTVTGTPPPVSSYVNTGNVYMFALDTNAGKLWCGQDGAWYNSGDPVGGNNPTISGLTGTIYPAVVFYNPSTDIYTANFGSMPMQYLPPQGYPPGFYQ